MRKPIEPMGLWRFEDEALGDIVGWYYVTNGNRTTGPFTKERALFEIRGRNVIMPMIDWGTAQRTRLDTNKQRQRRTKSDGMVSDLEEATGEAPRCGHPVEGFYRSEAEGTTYCRECLGG